LVETLFCKQKVGGSNLSTSRMKKRICFLKKNLAGMKKGDSLLYTRKRKEFYGAYTLLLQNNLSHFRIKRSDILEFNLEDVQEIDGFPLIPITITTI
jgi:hypothetical protein